MKTAISLCVILACTHAFAEETWTNSLKPAGQATAPFTIIADGQPAGSILLPADALPPARKAAEELSRWVAEMTGGKLPVVSDPATAGPHIRLITDAKLADEQYAITVEGKDLVLSGGVGRGVINAVYALLEEDIGCRFYTNESIRLPRSKSLSVAVVPRTYSPQLRLRDPFYFSSFDAEWSLRNRTNAPRAVVAEDAGGRVNYAGDDVHSHASLLPPAEYFKDHPEYFMLDAAGNRQPVQVCPTDPDVARIVTEHVLALLAKDPNAEIVTVSKNDNFGDQICRCERCLKLREAEGGTDMANQLTLVNAVAEAVEKSHPKVWVDTLAYIETVQPPKTIRPRKNVVIRLCNDMIGAWSKPFTPARQTAMADVTKRWSAIHDRLSIWDYNVNFSHYLAPMPNMNVIADNLRFWTENKAVGILTQGGYQSTSERDELRSWVIAKLMWDPTRDAQALVNDFIAGHYGKAAPFIAEYESQLADTAKTHADELQNIAGGIRYPMTVAFLSKEFLQKSQDIFARARQAAAGDAPLLARVERAELPVLYAMLSQGAVTKDAFDRFERIAREAKVRYLAEGATPIDTQIEQWRKQLAAATPK
jgi:hypothetical protein